MPENGLLEDLICVIEISFQDLRGERDVQLHFVLRCYEGRYLFVGRAHMHPHCAIVNGIYLFMFTSVLQILTA